MELGVDVLEDPDYPGEHIVVISSKIVYPEMEKLESKNKPRLIKDLFRLSISALELQLR